MKVALSKSQLNTMLLVIGIIVLAGVLRSHKYAEFPPIGETKDEYAWTFLGASLLQTGQPISWSHFATYQPIRVIHFGADQFPLVTPAMDHPPLFSLIPGLFQTMVASWDQEPRFTVIRFPMVLLGVINVLLVYLVGQSLYQKKTALLATLFFATAPLFVFSSRMVLAENLLITELLAAIWIYHSKSFSRFKFPLLTIFLASAVLTKLAGIVLPASFLLLALVNKDKKLLISSMLGLVLGAGLFALYGGWYDWSTFISTFAAQSQRLIGLATLHNRFFLHPNILSRIFIDGWLTLGLLALLWSSFTRGEKKYQLIHLSGLLTLLFIAVTVGETTYHGWYAYPLFPLFALAVADVLVTLIEKKNWLGIWLIWLLILPAFRTATGYQEMEISPLIIKVLVLLGGLPLGLSLLKVTQPLIKVALSCLLIAVLWAHIMTVWNVRAERYWEDDEVFQPKMIVK